MGSACNSTRTGFYQSIEYIELGLVKCLVICSQGRFVRCGDGWFEQLGDRHRECALSAGNARLVWKWMEARVQSAL
jgi:hypothetical protein